MKGTDMILAGCMNEPSVKALVYASSLDVLVNIAHMDDKDGEDEFSCIYALDDPALEGNVDDMYGVTKTLAEKRVLKANRRDIDRLRTAAVRPVGIYGERDSVHLGSVLGAAKEMGSMMLFYFGDGSAVFQHVYVRNCAWMHVLAAKKLVEGDDRVAGQAFMGIDNTRVNNFFEFFHPYIAAKGYKVPTIGIPYWIAYPTAALTEDIFKTIGALCPSLVKGVKLTYTRRAIQGTCISAWFHTDKAKRLLGYEPLSTPMEARRRSIAFFDTLTDLFPQGPYKYKEREHDYPDDGVDYQPIAPKFLARRRRNEEAKRRGKKRSRVVTALFVLGGCGAIATVVLGKDRVMELLNEARSTITKMQ